MELFAALTFTLIAVLYYATATSKGDIVKFLMMLTCAVVWWINAFELLGPK